MTAAVSAALARLCRAQNRRARARRLSRSPLHGVALMTRERLYLFDTTLRDGQQTPGIDFSLEDKIVVAAHARRARHRLCRRRLSRRQPDRHRLLRREAHAARHLRRLRHDEAGRPLGLQRSRACRRCCRPRPTRSASSPRPGTIMSASRSAAPNEENLEAIRASVEAARRRGQRGAGRLRAFLRRLQGQSRPMRWPAREPPTRPARAGSCSATPMAARCRTRSRRSSREVAAGVPGQRISASMPMTTPARRSPIRWPRSRPACARSRAR